MAGPMTGLSAAQIATQKLQDQGASQVAKQGQSKFDQAMVSKASQTQQVQNVQAPQAASEVNRVNQVKQVDQVNKLDKAQLNKVNVNAQQGSNTLTAQAVDPVNAAQKSSRAISMMTSMASDMEKGQGMLDKLINGGLKGAKFSNTELLALQAGMYKYTQELDLTGKVVDKATNGLKETLKTQV